MGVAGIAGPQDFRISQYRCTQTHGVTVAHVIDPALHGGGDPARRDSALALRGKQRSIFPAKMQALSPFQSPPARNSMILERRAFPAGEKCAQHHTKPDVVVTVVRIVPVPIRAPDVPVIVVERPAANNAVCSDPPFFM